MTDIDRITPVVGMQSILESKEWLLSGEQVLAIEKPGEGNMNVVLRISTNRRSFVLKQSRPYVEKYQQIGAPLNRIEVEHSFYQSVRGSEIDRHIPTILNFDAGDHLMMMEDLGQCESMTSLYKSRSIADESLQQLIHVIGLVHSARLPVDFPGNRELRELNHQHIFDLPFVENNGFDLDSVQPGLQDLSLAFKKDEAVKRCVKSVGGMYLSEGDTLLHGDYYPGSWMMGEGKLYVIDPEFGFAGFAEFDLGVMAGHLMMATMDDSALQTIERDYDGRIRGELLRQVAGIEIVRRLIGLAQLPLERSLEEKAALLQMGREMIVA